MGWELERTGEGRGRQSEVPHPAERTALTETISFPFMSSIRNQLHVNTCGHALILSEDPESSVYMLQATTERHLTVTE